MANGRLLFLTLPWCIMLHLLESFRIVSFYTCQYWVLDNMAHPQLIFITCHPSYLGIIIVCVTHVTLDTRLPFLSCVHWKDRKQLVCVMAAGVRWWASLSFRYTHFNSYCVWCHILCMSQCLCIPYANMIQCTACLWDTCHHEYCYLVKPH